MKCARCPFPAEERLCVSADGAAPPECPTLDGELVNRVIHALGEPSLREFARQASLQEAEGYTDGVPCRPRLVETAEFAERMGFSRLGLVFCTGLRREAETVESFLAGRGFEVVSVICKAGRVPKEEIGVRDREKIVPGSMEPMCNPVLQASVLNREGTEFNIVMGLCVGHDSIFLSHSKAPCTVLAAKDRLTGHNPLAAVYTLESYYRYLTRRD